MMTNAQAALIAAASMPAPLNADAVMLTRYRAGELLKWLEVEDAKDTAAQEKPISSPPVAPQGMYKQPRGHDMYTDPLGMQMTTTKDTNWPSYDH